MNLPTILLFVGLAYIVLFGLLSFLKREGLSLRFAIEAIIITGLVSGLTALTGFATHPVFFLVLLYMVTLRVRLLVDLANVLAKRGQHEYANKLYDLALRLWPDASSRLIVQVNQGTSLIKQNHLDEGANLLQKVLGEETEGFLGVKYEAAAHYNLGVAYQRKGLDARAAVEFNAAIDSWPASLYARRAQAALAKRRQKNPPTDHN